MKDISKYINEKLEEERLYEEQSALYFNNEDTDAELLQEGLLEWFKKFLSKTSNLLKKWFRKNKNRTLNVTDRNKMHLMIEKQDASVRELSEYFIDRTDNNGEPALFARIFPNTAKYLKRHEEMNPGKPYENDGTIKPDRIDQETWKSFIQERVLTYSPSSTKIKDGLPVVHMIYTKYIDGLNESAENTIRGGKNQQYNIFLLPNYCHIYYIEVANFVKNIDWNAVIELMLTPILSEHVYDGITITKDDYINRSFIKNITINELNDWEKLRESSGDKNFWKLKFPEKKKKKNNGDTN